MWELEHITVVGSNVQKKIKIKIKNKKGSNVTKIPHVARIRFVDAWKCVEINDAIWISFLFQC